MQPAQQPDIRCITPSICCFGGAVCAGVPDTDHPILRVVASVDRKSLLGQRRLACGSDGAWPGSGSSGITPGEDPDLRAPVFAGRVL